MYKKLIKDIFIYGLGTALPRAINLVFTYFFTDLLHPEAYANINDVFLFDFLMIQVLTFGFETAIFRFASQNESKPTTAKTALYVVGTVAVIFLVIGLEYYPQLAAFRSYPAEYALFAILIITSDTFLALGYTYLRLQEKSVKFSALKILNVIVNAVVLLFFFAIKTPVLINIKNLFDDGGLILIATLIASLASLMGISGEFIKIIRKGVFNLSLAKKMFFFGSPIALASIAYALNETFDKLFMKSALGEKITGAYGACYKLGVFIMLYEMAFRLGIEPFFFKKMKQTNRDKIYADAILIYTLFGSVVFVSVIANLSWLKHLIIGSSEYFIALKIVPIILLANLILGIYRNISIWYKVIDKTFFSTLFSLAGLCITLLGNIFIMTRMQDFQVAAWTTLAAYSSMLLLSYLFSRKYNPIPYNLKKIGFYLMVSSVMSYIIFQCKLDIFFNNMILISYLIVILLVEFKSMKSYIIKK